jgi:hypothetical protein
MPLLWASAPSLGRSWRFVLSNAGRDHHTLELVLAGVALTIVGIFLITWGGRIHDLDTRSHPELGRQQAYAAAIGLAVLCWVLAPMLNYSFAFGKPIADRAIAAGNTAAHAGYAIWPIGLAGFLPNAAYSLALEEPYALAPRQWSRPPPPSTCGALSIRHQRFSNSSVWRRGQLLDGRQSGSCHYRMNTDC